MDKFNEDAEFLRTIAENPLPYFAYYDDVKLSMTGKLLVTLSEVTSLSHEQI